VSKQFQTILGKRFRRRKRKLLKIFPFIHLLKLLQVRDVKFFEYQSSNCDTIVSVSIVAYVTVVNVAVDNAVVVVVSDVNFYKFKDVSVHNSKIFWFRETNTA